MGKLAMALGRETVVAYMVVLTFQGEINNNYPKIYKRYGDAFKRCDHLNKVIKSDEYKWKIMCAKGWYEVDPNDKGE